MAHVLTEEERKELLEYIEKYEPYDDDDPIIHRFDGDERDDHRMMATIAKRSLEGKA